VAVADSLLGRSETTVRASLAIGTLVAGIVYGLAYVGATAFYSRFRLRPEDVGLNQGSILPRALAVLGFFLLLSAALTLGGALGWLFAGSINARIAAPLHQAASWLLQDLPSLRERLLRQDRRLGWVAAVALSIALLAATTAVDQALGRGVLVLLPIVAVPLGAAVRNSVEHAGKERRAVLSVVGLLVIVCVSFGAYYAITDGVNRLSESLITSGHFETDHRFDRFLSSVLGLRPALVQARGLECAVLLGTDGDHVWVLEQVPTTRGRTTTVVRSVDAEASRIWPLPHGEPPTCWT